MFSSHDHLDIWRARSFFEDKACFSCGVLSAIACSERSCASIIVALLKNALSILSSDSSLGVISRWLMLQVPVAIGGGCTTEVYSLRIAF